MLVSELWSAENLEPVASLPPPTAPWRQGVAEQEQELGEAARKAAILAKRRQFLGPNLTLFFADDPLEIVEGRGCQVGPHGGGRWALIVRSLETADRTHCHCCARAALRPRWQQLSGLHQQRERLDGLAHQDKCNLGALFAACRHGTPPTLSPPASATTYPHAQLRCLPACRCCKTALTSSQCCCWSTAALTACHCWRWCWVQVSHVGHAHPRVAAAVSRQLFTLNTNSRYLNADLVTYAERLQATAPDPLQVPRRGCCAAAAEPLLLHLLHLHCLGLQAGGGRYHQLSSGVGGRVPAPTCCAWLALCACTFMLM